MGNKRSPVWGMSRGDFQQLYDDKSSAVEILMSLGMSSKGSNYSTLQRRVAKDGICLKKHLENRTKASRQYWESFYHLDQVLVQNSTCHRGKLKKMLLESGTLENKCAECGLGPEWNGKKLVLQLEHNNGVRNDNRLENLCMLCPNCHSQTDTFAGRNLRRKPIRVPLRKWPPRPESRKVEWPSKELLGRLLWEKPTVQIAEQYGVSDGAVGKWAKKYGLDKPPRGYWASNKPALTGD